MNWKLVTAAEYVSIPSGLEFFTVPDQNDFLDETPIMGIHGPASYHRGETIGSRTLQIRFGGHHS